MNPIRDAFQPPLAQPPLVQPVAQTRPVPPHAMGGAGFMPGAAGDKTYLNGAVTAPTRGPVTNITGYQQRDQMAQARRNALINRMGKLS